MLNPIYVLPAHRILTVPPEKSVIQQTETAWLAFQQLTVLQESVTLPPILVSRASPIQTVQQDNSVIQLQIHASSAFLTPIAQPDFNVSLLKEHAELCAPLTTIVLSTPFAASAQAHRHV